MRIIKELRQNWSMRRWHREVVALKTIRREIKLLRVVKCWGKAIAQTGTTINNFAAVARRFADGVK